MAGALFEENGQMAFPHKTALFGNFPNREIAFGKQVSCVVDAVFYDEFTD